MEKVINILVVVDPQNDFIYGSLANEEAQKTVPFIVAKINQRRVEGYLIATTRDTHGKNYLNTLEGKNLPVEHCVEDTWGWEICNPIEQVLDEHNDIIINKTTFGCIDLYQKIINDFLRRGLINSDDVENATFKFELIGFCTDICVVSNAMILKASGDNIEVSVDPYCCAGTTKDNHYFALRTMESCHVKIMY